MKPLRINVTPATFRRHYISLMNGLLYLTEREIDVLAALMNANAQEPCLPKDRITVAHTLGMSVAVLNNFIKALKDKGVLIADGKSYSYHLLLDVPKDLKTLTINFSHSGS